MNHIPQCRRQQQALCCLLAFLQQTSPQFPWKKVTILDFPQPQQAALHLLAHLSCLVKEVSRIDIILTLLELIIFQRSHSPWKTWKNDNCFSSPGKVLEFYNFIKNPGKMGVNLEK